MDAKHYAHKSMFDHGPYQTTLLVGTHNDQLMTSIKIRRVAQMASDCFSTVAATF